MGGLDWVDGGGLVGSHRVGIYVHEGFQEGKKWRNQWMVIEGKVFQGWSR